MLANEKLCNNTAATLLHNSFHLKLSDSREQNGTNQANQSVQRLYTRQDGHSLTHLHDFSTAGFSTQTDR